MKRCLNTMFLFFLFAEVSLVSTSVLARPHVPTHAADLQHSLTETIQNTSFLSQSDRAFTKHSKSADFLFASSQKILMRWNGQIAALSTKARLASQSFTEANDLPVGAAIFERTLQAKHLSDLFAPKNPSSSEPDPEVAGLVCFSRGLVVIFAPQTHDLMQHSRFFTAPEILANSYPERLTAKDQSEMPELVSCALNTHGDLLIMHKDASGLNLSFPLSGSANKAAPKRLYSPDPTEGNKLSLAVLETANSLGSSIWAVVSQADHSIELLNDSLETTASFQDFNTTEYSRVVIRDSQVLVSSEGKVTLSKYDSASNRFTHKRLSISPCEDDTTCAVSLGSDGSWAVSGYWGTYIGTGTDFKRIPLRNFSMEDFPIVFSHSSANGHFAVFGADDADMGQLDQIRNPTMLTVPAHEPHAPAETQWSKRLDRLTRTPPQAERAAAAWLKSHARLDPKETILFQIGNTKVILTPFGFDPKRFVAWEPQRMLPALAANPQLPASFASGSWWKETLGLDESLALLQLNGIEPAPVRIAILDSGADFSHPDFHPESDTLAPQPHFDFVDHDADPSDQMGHGTHVSGLAKPNDPAFAELFKNIELLIVRVLDERGKSNSIDIGMGFIYAADAQSSIINASWGGGARTQFMEDSILYATERGALVITSAGNDALNIDRLDPEPAPGGFPGVLAIGASKNSGPAGQRARFSNYGQKRVFGFAPGETISSLKLGGGYTEKSGTSMAAPLASAMVGVALGIYRSANNMSDWRSKIQEAFCTRRSTGPLLRDSRCGALNLRDALEFLLSTSLVHE